MRSYIRWFGLCVVLFVMGNPFLNIGCGVPPEQEPATKESVHSEPVIHQDGSVVETHKVQPERTLVQDKIEKSPDGQAVDVDPSDFVLTESTPEQKASTEKTPEESPKPTETCIQEGKSVTPKGQCCAGLKAIANVHVPDCSRPKGAICTACGNGTCDEKAGENICNCPQDCKISCNTRKDCSQKLACRENQKGCEQSFVDCVQGQCTAQKVPLRSGFVCNPKNNQCTRRCQRDNDCLGRPRMCQNSAQGCFTVSAKCSAGYCYFAQTPPEPTKACHTQTASCIEKSKICQKTEDCFSNGTITYTCTPHPQGGCTKRTLKCYQGRCLPSSGHAVGYKCNPVTRQCARNLCKIDCDCPQGQSCVQGACANAPKQSFCCSNAGCPVGVQCVERSGKKSTCAKPSTCATDKGCGVSYCTDTDASTCVEYLPKCSGNACSLTPKTVPLSQCNRTTGRCKALACVASANCGKSTCAQTATHCVQSTPTCSNKACKLVRSHKPSSAYQCNAKGSCEAKVCTKNTDCGIDACGGSNLSCTTQKFACLPQGRGKPNRCYWRAYPYTSADVHLCRPGKTACERPSCRGRYGDVCARSCEMTATHCVQRVAKCISVVVCREDAKSILRDASIFQCDAAKGQCLCTNPGQSCAKPRCHVSSKKLCYDVTYTCAADGSCKSKSVFRGDTQKGWKCKSGAATCSR